ncbi:hypothetical protein [Curtobacterium aurantiacum]|uniref:hypothetical protein n=1 Tax=Curtobacterium aurantiacum TaxID=3236919 RepID=UPI001BE0C2E8|nr:hypothetical protein [Curtobacterium flaccumfaciens]MBT1676008.1 hypothetical protein [Curtobacterium flaccumfaciens pv. flaccumfaciens]
MNIIPVDPIVLALGDQPIGEFQAEFVDDRGDVADVPADELTAELVTAGSAPARYTVAVRATEELVTITWPDMPALTVAGVLRVVVRGNGVRIGTLRLVVEDYTTGWLTIDDVRARTSWADAPDDDVTLYEVLEASRVACINWAPALAEGELPPANYLIAQLMQARSVWNSVKSGPGDQIGADGFTVRVFPLDATVKAQLRPKRALPVIR